MLLVGNRSTGGGEQWPMSQFILSAMARASREWKLGPQATTIRGSWGNAGSPSVSFVANGMETRRPTPTEHFPSALTV